MSNGKSILEGTMGKEYATHKAWWLDNTDAGRLYKQLHTYQHGKRCYEKAFWISGLCPKCGHNAPEIYKPDLLEAPYDYICQRRNNPVGFAHLQCLYEGSIVLDDTGVEKVMGLMKLKVEKLKAIMRINEIDEELKPNIPTFKLDAMQFYFGK